MEHINDATNTSGTAHYAVDSIYKKSGGDLPVPDVTAFHVYSIEWDKDSINWKVDGLSFHKLVITDNMVSFRQAHFILLNMAIGGNWPGNVIGDTYFPCKMQVDYVRVYSRQ